MITRKDFLLGAAATATTASAIDGASIGGTGRTRGLMGGAFMGAMMAQNQGETMVTIKAESDMYTDDEVNAWLQGLGFDPGTAMFLLVRKSPFRKNRDGDYGTLNLVISPKGSNMANRWGLLRTPTTVAYPPPTSIGTVFATGAKGGILKGDEYYVIPIEFVP